MTKNTIWWPYLCYIIFILSGIYETLSGILSTNILILYQTSWIIKVQHKGSIVFTSFSFTLKSIGNKRGKKCVATIIPPVLVRKGTPLLSLSCSFHPWASHECVTNEKLWHKRAFPNILKSDWAMRTGVGLKGKPGGLPLETGNTRRRKGGVRESRVT